MPTDIKLPNMGDGVDSGDVLDVLVKEGDTVTKDQGLIELETGKATVQVPSTMAGKIVKVHVKKGQTIPIGAAIVSVEGSGAPPAAPAPAKAAPAKAPEKAPAPVAEAPKPAPKPVAEAPKPAPVAKPLPVAKPIVASAPAVEVAEADDGSDDSIPAGPAVRRFAREVGIDLRRVTGSGIGGRISREDVLAAVRQASAAAPGPTKSGSTERDNWGSIRTEKMSRIRKTIAEKMHESWSTIPRVTNFDDADVTELERIRVASKDDYAAKGIKLTTLPFVVKAVAMALRSHPTINASVDMEQDQIIYKEYVNVGIAIDTERGLVVPSLRKADTLSISDIARALATLADNVKTGNFSLADLQGSTFSISNLGAIGGTYSCPIINPPEVAILLIGRSRKLPVVIDDKVEIRLMMPLSLSYDHRLVDGERQPGF